MNTNHQSQDENPTVAANETTAEATSTAKAKPVVDYNELVNRTSSGAYQLSTAIRAGGKDVKELQYDFSELTGWEYAEALDSDKNAQTIFRLTAKQASNLFAMAAGKATPDIDANDIKERIGAEDSMAAVQLAILFFNSCALKRNNATTKK